ncbi:MULTISPECIES: S8 family peptidase [unclassified Bacillus (in: firmicutes)]|uniref:S8 family peptidase n=1 Tax=unclassified Bacillus (in: firmicutes) TaxID=185979 RepID=UPI0008E9958B|nr:MULTISPECIES: S8 family peptidase [unclassified Bacillus (in: firmicutes)]SFB25373.1 minor extracellular protease Epr [Bacillus sp. UNCCL13]SFQ91724.1 minor extracellular protease Epr [Bacillus sp. cl95]
MRKLTLLMAIILYSGTLLNIPAANAAQNPEKRMIVTFVNGEVSAKAKAATQEKERAFVKQHKKKIVKNVAAGRSYVAMLSASQSEELNKDENIIVEKDAKVKINAYYPINKNWGSLRTGGQQVNNQGITGTGVKVGIIDTGIYATHPQLKVSGGYNFVSGNTNFNDDNGHGTHVAGIVAAKQAATNTFYGIAPNAELFGLKVLNSDGDGYVSDIVAAIDWSIANDMDIINMSLGLYEPVFALEDAVNRAYSQGIIVVAAAGNDGGVNTVNYPAKYKSVISVSALDQKDIIADFSSTGREVEISAPGDRIYSSYLGGFAYLSGTSMAAPHVTGIIALYKQKYPTYSHEKIRQMIDGNAIDLGPIGRDATYGYGLVQAPHFESAGHEVMWLQSKRRNPNEVYLMWKSNGQQTYLLKKNGKVIYKGKSTSFIDKKALSAIDNQYTLSIVAPDRTNKTWTTVVNASAK